MPVLALVLTVACIHNFVRADEMTARFNENTAAAGTNSPAVLRPIAWLLGSARRTRMISAFGALLFGTRFVMGLV